MFNMTAVRSHKSNTNLTKSSVFASTSTTTTTSNTTSTTPTTTTSATTTTTEMKESCVEVMMAAFNFYKELQATTESAKSHSGKFKHISRMDIFESNMRKWGNKLTKHGCNCDRDFVEDISSSTSLGKFFMTSNIKLT